MAKAIQFKVSLEGITPKIWRRFVVGDDVTFQQLHEAIQAVMGWENYHLYQFHVGDLCFEEPDPESLADGEDERGATAEKVLDHVSVGDKPLAYLYDFGDCWEHVLEVEKVLDADEFEDVPCCVGGERACPPEDCGGVHGFEHLLKVMGDKKHKEYKELIVDWLEEGYDPESFSVDEANERLNDPDCFADDDDDETIDEDDFVPLGELLLEDTPEAKSIKSIEGKELNYANYLFSVESAVMEYFMDDRKLTDKDVIRIIEKVKAGYLGPLDSFGEGLERDIMLGLSSALQGGGITHHELKLVLNHVLWAIDNRSWLGSSQAYVKWLPYYFNLYSDEEDERYRKNFTRRARRIGVPQKEIGGMLERSEDDCDDDGEEIDFDDLRFDSENDEDNKELFEGCFLSDPNGFQAYVKRLEEKEDYASVEKAYKVAMEVMGFPLLEFMLGVNYLKMNDRKLARHHIENSIKNIEGMPEDEWDSLGLVDKPMMLSQMRHTLDNIGE